MIYSNDKNSVIKYYCDEAIKALKISNYKKAIKFFDKALEIAPYHKTISEEKIFALYYRGDELCNNKSFKEAIACYDKILEIEPKNNNAFEEKIKVLYCEAKDFFLKRNYGKAIQNYKKISELETEGFDTCEKHIKNTLIAQSETEKIMAGLKLKADDYLREGFYYYFLDNYEDSNQKALTFFDKALKVEPKYKEAQNYKGKVLEKLGRHNEAIESFNKALEIDPRYKEAWNYKGNTLYYQGKYKEAMECYDKALGIEPEYVDAWYYKGNLFFHTKRYDRAIECHKKAIKIINKEEKENIIKEDVLYYLGQSFYQKKNYEEATKYFNKVLEINPKKIEARSFKEECLQIQEDILFSKGMDLYNQENYKEAIKYFDEILEINSENTSAWKCKGDALCQQNNYEGSIKCYKKALKIEPANEKILEAKIELLLIWAENLYENDNYEEAIKCYDKILNFNNPDHYKELINFYNKILNIEPDNFKVRKNKKIILLNEGKIFNNQGNYEEALKCYDEVLELEPESIEALISKGKVFNNQGNYEEALKCYDEVLELEPESIEALISKGKVFNNQGNYEEALKCYDEVLKFEPESIEALVSKGKVFNNQGNYEEALRCYDEVLDIEIWHIPAAIGKGETFNNQGNYEEALRYYDEVLEFKPDNIEAVIGKGETFNNQGNYEEALKCCDEVLLLNSENNRALICKGEILNKLGNYKDIYYEKILGFKSNNQGFKVNNIKALWAYSKEQIKQKKYKEVLECYNKIIKFNLEDEEIEKIIMREEKQVWVPLIFKYNDKILLKWNSDWETYNFLGGKFDSTQDKAVEDTVERRLEKELGFEINIHCTFKKLSDKFRFIQLSPRREDKKCFYICYAYQIISLKSFDEIEKIIKEKNKKLLKNLKEEKKKLPPNKKETLKWFSIDELSQAEQLDDTGNILILPDKKTKIAGALIHILWNINKTEELSEKENLIKYTLSNIPDSFNDILIKLRKEGVMLGISRRSLQLAKEIEEAVNDPFERPVMLIGPTGAGKSRIAKVIHNLSKRGENRDKFASATLTGINDENFQCTLFGYVKGAYTGAKEKGDEGLLFNNNGGTVFLDEVTTIKEDSQAIFLNTLGRDFFQGSTNYTFYRYGGSGLEEEKRYANVRFISATNEEPQIKANKITFPGFREDLTSRLADHLIIIPSIKELEEDWIFIIDSLLKKFTDNPSKSNEVNVSKKRILASLFNNPLISDDTLKDFELNLKMDNKTKKLLFDGRYDLSWNFRTLIQILTQAITNAIKDIKIKEDEKSKVIYIREKDLPDYTERRVINDDR